MPISGHGLRLRVTVEPISDIGIFLHKNSYSMLDVGTACPFDVRLQNAAS